MPESDHALPTIGIVSPSYNQGAFIGAMLNSIERQTLAPTEHIILDGGSKDDSREQITAYAQRHGYVSAVLEPDDGQVDAINRGLESARSEVLTWLNTDDFYSDAGALRAVAQVFADEPDTDVVYARGEFIDAQGKVLREAYVNDQPETFPETIKHSIRILQPALFFRRSAIEKVGLLDGRWNLSLDYELWIRFINAGLKMRFLDRLIVRAVLHDESKTGGSRGKQYDEIEALTAEHFGFVPLWWLTRHAEFLVDGKDGIVESRGAAPDRDKIDAEIGLLQQQWNGSPGAIAAIEACKDEPESMRTLADLCRRGMLGAQHVAVTSFTSANFRQGLNLLASLGRHAQGRFDRVLVYSIDLKDEQKRRLAAFDGVVVMDYPAECRSFFEGCFAPQKYSYKCAAIWDAQHAVDNGGTVLWIDAGVALARPIDEILGIIERDGVFFVDHDDKPEWPFLNATFTHPVAAEAMDASAEELLAPHLCSCLLGYRKAAVGNTLVDEAYQYSQRAEVVVSSKHLPANETREFAALTPQDREWLAAAPASPDRATREQVYQRGAYLGHRQEQSIYSILCARHRCKQHSAKRFCWSGDESSMTSHASSTSDSELKRSRALPASMPVTALTFHHRGLHDRLEGLPWARQSETVFVLGNGPSLKGFDFASLDGFDTIGMNAAYRHWDRTGWYPSIYACMDTVVIKSHAKQIERLVRERRANGIRLFFLRKDIIELCPGLAKEPNVMFFEDLRSASDLLDTDMITTGSLSALFGGFLGYKRVAVLGVDCDYVEKLPEAESGDGHQLVINVTPASNPNYFFDDYQQQGDAYNIPNVHPGFHTRSWKAALGLLERAGVEIVNCNGQSKLTALPIAELEVVLAEPATAGERRPAKQTARAPAASGLPTIGIVSPSYNQSAFIGAMLNSIERQTLAPTEHIIQDGGSTDGTVDQLKAYAERHSGVSLHVEDDEGQVDAINRGFRRSTADIVTWLNTDDVYSDPDALRAVAEAFATEPELDVLYARGRFVGPDGTPMRDAFIHQSPATLERELTHSVGILQPALFYRRSVIDRFGQLDESLNFAFDYEYWIRLARRGARFGFLDRFLVDATLHENSKTQSMRGRQYEETIEAVHRHYGFVPVRWLNRLAELEALGIDGIVRTTLDVADSDRPKVDQRLGELQAKWNSSPEAHLQLLRRPAVGPGSGPITETLEDLRSRSMNQTPRLIVTAFDGAYFRQGLNLIASLHRHREDEFSTVVVYDLGLSASQRDRLNDLEGVAVRDFPEEVSEFFDGYMSPKNYSYKCAAIRAAGELVADGDVVLWIDAGVAVVRDVEEIFGIIERDGVFFVDHDDKPGWPFRNATFTHREAAVRMRATGRELLAPHLCSCLLGYVKNGPAQPLIETAYTYSQDPSIVSWSKHPGPDETRGMGALSDVQRAKYAELVEATKAGGEVDPGAVLDTTPYLGHRQDQSIYSVLCARHGFKQHSATRFCWSNDNSSRASLENWKSGGESDSLRRGRRVDWPVSSLTFHHRGIYDNLDGLRLAQRSDTLVVLGNGPSLKGFDFASLDGADTIGMNAAYRHWDRIGWYPTYYCCMDKVVILSHKDAILRMIRERKRNGIRRFFLREILAQEHPEIRDDPSVVILEDERDAHSLLQVKDITTGNLSALFGATLGYRRIALLGIDCNYVEQIKGSELAGGTKLAIAETPGTNPNYFFDDYQQAGDLYNIPNVTPGFHAGSWVETERMLTAAGVEVVNCNPQSKLTAFPRADLEQSIRCELPRCETEVDRGIIAAEFGRDAKARIEEIDFIATAIGKSHADDLMVDVGTHHGGSLKAFIESGWRVLGFEPDPSNRRVVIDRFGAHDRLTIDPRAVSDKPAEGVNFFSTDESSGASSLSAFTGGHEASATVDVTTLESALAEHKVDAVRLLKVDAEGYDLMVLNGLPWDRIRPDAIMVEFEDRKTTPIGYTTADMAAALVSRGYTVYCSEWHPIVRYGIRHDWRRLFRWGTEQPATQSWGNLVAFRYQADAEAFEQQVLNAIRRGHLTGAPTAVPAPSPAPDRTPPKKHQQSATAAGDYEQSVQRLAHLASHAAATPPAPLPPQPMVAGAMPWAPKALGEMSLARHVAMSVGKIGRVYAGRAGVLAFATLACWAAGVATLANGQPYWVGLSLAGAAFIPLFVLIGFIAVTARRQAFENGEALRYATERGIRWAAEHQRAQQHAAGGYTNALVAQAAQLLATQERRRLATRIALDRMIRAAAKETTKSEEALRKAIDAAIEAVSKSEASVADLRGDVAETRGSIDASVASLGEELRSEIRASRQDSEKSFVSLGDGLRTDLASAREASQQHMSQAATLAELSRALAEQALEAAKAVRTEHQQTAESHAEGIKKALKTAQAAAELASDAGRDADESLTKHAARTDARLDQGDHQLSRLRGDAYTQFMRVITPALEEGVSKLGVPLQRGELKYMERKLQVIEGQCEGRLAGSVDDAIARSLAARTWKGEELRILEIGVLFGIGAIYMHRVLSPFFAHVHLSLLDPFDGYYGSDHLDPLTGQPVTRAMLERNLSRGGVPMDDVTIIDRFSTDQAAVKRAGDGSPYAVIIIDGDHSYEGVKADYELYADMVAPGGVLIVDDYGSKDWPEVTAYASEVIERDKRFAKVAVLGKTAIYRRTAVRAGSTAETKPFAKPKAQPTAKPTAAPKSTESAKQPATKPAGKAATKTVAKPTGSSKKPTTKPKHQPADGSLPFAD